MTLPDERTRSIVQTRELLEELAGVRAKAETPFDLKAEAKRLLRHYPDADVISVMCREMPDWYQSWSR